MPGGYGTEETPWGSAGITAPSGSYSGPHDTNEGPNTVADAVNAFQSAPPQLSFTPDLQNQAQLAIAQHNIDQGIGKYAGQFPEYDMMPSEDETFQGQNVPGMTTGFGSVFGASSGSTASSQTVQDVLNFMIDDKIAQKKEETGNNMLSSQDLNQAIDDAYETYYPGWNEYKYGEGDIPVNLMDMDIGAPLPGHQTIADLRRPSFDDWWYGDEGTPWEQEWWDYPAGDEETTMAQLGTWGADPLPVESLSMGERKPMYGSELGEEFVASPLFMAGLESTTGIPYPGLPKFGTIEMGEV